MPLDCWDLSRQWPGLGASGTEGMDAIIQFECVQDRCGMLAKSAGSGRHTVHDS